MPVRREDRLSGERQLDQRSTFQRDRDRILYAGVFRRLVGVTQVVSPSEGEVFHNRLTHTLKVAQVARRIAEMFQRRTRDANRIEGWGGLDPEVVEAAAMAHDLGHPPFGHIAEDELNKLVTPLAGAGGYEGNAQSFRIITRLAVRRVDTEGGLDLTRAVLDATLKYPCLPRAGLKKYGAYRDDLAAFEFARGLHAQDDPAQSLEAEIMDWADDITYSVHDTEDFYRAGLIPLDVLAGNEEERRRFLNYAIKVQQQANKPFAESAEELNFIFTRFWEWLPWEKYVGKRSQRGALAQFVSKTVSDYVQATRLRSSRGDDGKALDVPQEYRTQVVLLKLLTRYYVIDNPSLAGHQYGQRKVIRTLFEIYLDSAVKGAWILFPPQFREEAESVLREVGDVTPARCARLVADTIASMTDQQALRLYHRLTGLSQGSVLDPIVS
jgi:dGTPase